MVKGMAVDHQELIRSERSRVELPRHGGLRLAIGYPNTYHVAQSSLAFQWVVEIAAEQPDVAVERFYADPGLAGASFENRIPLAEFDLLAWSCSFELDAVNLLRVLDAAGIPRRRRQRGPRFPLLVLGGAVSSINPLPLAPAVDVFVLGAAELLFPPLLRLVRELDRDGLLEELATRDGYFVPLHHLDDAGRPRQRVRRLEKRDVHMAKPELIPCSNTVTPHTEYSDRGLVEMSRGCPEKCRYCWVSYNYGRLRCYPEDGIMDRVREIRRLTDRVGFVATAVGDHPKLPEILAECRSLGLNVALSSLRIPAMVPEVLEPLADSGARSVTIAPETGTDDLRRRLNKPISNTRILEAVETAQRCGIWSLKMYFIVGLPGETDDDLDGIAKLVRDALEILRAWGRDRGRMGTLHVGVSVLVPKPYTPYQRSPMLPSAEAKRRLDLVWRRLRGASNLKLDRPSHREALWQGFLSRGDTDAFPMLERIAGGDPLGRVMTDHRSAIEATALPGVEGEPVWAFVSSAPQPPRK
jgi:radical SAM superfamily enzyme YgiQ (UPF0313 family)